MDLTVTINDANGNPTILHARSIHIESNANSINVVPAPAAATVPSVASTAIPQQQEYTEDFVKNHNDFEATKQQINEQMKKRYSETPNNTLALAQEHQDMINKATNVANSNLELLQSANKVYKPPANAIGAAQNLIGNIPTQAYNAPIYTKDNPAFLQPLKRGGSKKRHNKRAKRTHKHRRLHKMSSKR